MTHSFPELIQQFNALQQLAGARHQRLVLLLDGEPDECQQAAAKLWFQADGSRVWLGSASDQAIDAMALSKARTLLGQERALAVFNGFDGINLSALAAVAGTLRGGGVLVLLLPTLEQLAEFADPALFNLTGLEPAQLPKRHPFLARLQRLLATDAAIFRARSASTPPAVPELTSPTPTSELIYPCMTREQQVVSDAMISLMSQRAHRPLVLMADRGRGKSTSLGIAAARLMQSRRIRIIITAPSPRAVTSAFAIAEQLLAGAQRQQLRLSLGQSSLSFVAPDELLASEPQADLLLVDEAAAIPASMLAQMLDCYPRVVYSTTVHGYEGTGRGFAVRFFQHLDQQAPNWQQLQMKTPIRWRDGDPLERFLFAALLLDAEPASLPEGAIPAPERCEYRLLQGADLVENDTLYRQICGLLITAHYQTRPEDIRAILDNPRLYTLVQLQGDTLLAAALILREGELPTELEQPIWLNQRRPRGHLLPVSLSAQLGLPNAIGLSFARVMRIAVHPQCQRHGFGSLLLRQVMKSALQLGTDLVGSSFGATPALLPFWLRAGYQPVRLGFSRDASSGEHSVMMLEGLSTAGETLLSQAIASFAADLDAWLGGPLADLETPLVLQLLKYKTASAKPEKDWSDLVAFGYGQRNLDDCLGALKRFCYQLHRIESTFASQSTQLLIAAALQYQPEQRLIRQYCLNGRKQLQQQLRLIVRQGLERLAPEHWQARLAKLNLRNK